MSKSVIPLAEARVCANNIISILAPYTKRIEIAGSVRRCKDSVGDIEIVAIPKYSETKDIFGNMIYVQSMLDEFDYSSIGRFIKGKSRYKQILLPEGISLDLFIVIHPAQFGVIFMIRTGPPEFSRHMVTQKRLGGALPSNCCVQDGAVWRTDGIIPMPEETDYFKWCGVEYIRPEDRT